MRDRRFTIGLVVALGLVILCVLAIAAGWFFVVVPYVNRVTGQITTPCNIVVFDDQNANGQPDVGEAQVYPPEAEIVISGSNGVVTRAPATGCYVPQSLQHQGVTITLHLSLPPGYTATTSDFVILYDNYAISDYAIGQPIYFGVQTTSTLTPNP